MLLYWRFIFFTEVLPPLTFISLLLMTFFCLRKIRKADYKVITKKVNAIITKKFMKDGKYILFTKFDDLELKICNYDLFNKLSPGNFIELNLVETQDKDGEVLRRQLKKDF